MSNDRQRPRGWPSGSHEYRRWSDDEPYPSHGHQPIGNGRPDDRPSPYPRGRPPEPATEDEEAVTDLEFDPAVGDELDGPNRFDISSYREGLFGGPGADLIGGGGFGPTEADHGESEYRESDHSGIDHSGADHSGADHSEFEVFGDFGASGGFGDPYESDSASAAESEIPPARYERYRYAEPPTDSAEESGTLVRPYTRTGGRTRPDYDLAIEALVSTSARGMQSKGDDASPEHQSICGLCVDARSVAEVAAHLRLPLGVARVLIGDMAGLGLVMVHQSTAVVGDRPSREFLERVLSGLRRL